MTAPDDPTGRDDSVSEEERVALSNLSALFGTARTLHELDQFLDDGLIEEGMGLLANKSSRRFIIYSLHRKRIIEGLDELPWDSLEVSWVRQCAIHCASEHLMRIGFILYYEDHREGILWRVNPLHPFERTLAELERKDPAYRRFAEFVLEKERDFLEGIRKVGGSDEDLREAVDLLMLVRSHRG